jgi:hypothetical protein
VQDGVLLGVGQGRIEEFRENRRRGRAVVDWCASAPGASIVCRVVVLIRANTFLTS